MVASIISAMVNKPQFIEAIKEKIGTSVDTKELENQISVMQGQIKQTIGIKNRLERQMDSLDIDDPHFDLKLADLQRRYDDQYDIIAEIEAQIDEVKSKILSIHQNNMNEETIMVAQILFAGSLADAEYRSDWDEALVRCLTIENMSYDNFKLAVENEFGVCIDHNVPLMDYFAAVGSEVGA